MGTRPTRKNEVLPGSPRSHRISEHVSSKHQILHGLPARLHHQQRKGSRDHPAFVSFPPAFFTSACSSCATFIARPRKTELRCRCTRARRDTIRVSRITVATTRRVHHLNPT